ncbi:glycosyltransferase family 2 protein [Phormidesmis sp. 146-12]
MISVITPVYNGEKFIESCLEAVIQQDCAAIEHIIVDGGSTDQTIEIVQQYAQRHTHIRWISEPDRGQSDAMNKGINLAKGEIIAVLNVDDYYEPQVLNQVLEQFKTLPNPSFLAGNCNIWDDAGHLVDVNRPTKLRLFDLVTGVNVHPYPCNPSAYFYHASLHQQVGPYKLDEHYAMDLEFILRAVRVATVKYVEVTWGNFRRIEGTKTHSDMQKGVMHRRVVQLLKEHRQFLSPIEQTQLWLRDQWLRIQFFSTQPQRLIHLCQTKLSKGYSEL